MVKPKYAEGTPGVVSFQGHLDYGTAVVIRQVMALSECIWYVVSPQGRDRSCFNLRECEFTPFKKEG